MISRGSELLLLVPSMTGIVGSLVLPILGAVPDGALILFSGLGPDAQNQVLVLPSAVAWGCMQAAVLCTCMCVWVVCVRVQASWTVPSCVPVQAL